MSNEPRTERNFNALENFGTDIESARLPPNAVLQAAREDFKRLERNGHQQEMINRGEVITPDYEHFAFHRNHVHKAAKAHPDARVIELLTLAIRFQSIGTESGKRNTRLIYKDVPVLQAAYKLAGGLADPQPEGPKESS